MFTKVGTLLLFTLYSTSTTLPLPMRKGSLMNPPHYFPRDPGRCVYHSFIFTFLGSSCSDPDCLVKDCPDWPPYDTKTGKRIHPWPPREGLNAVIEIWSDLQDLSKMMSTRKPPREFGLKPDIVIFLTCASSLTLIICAVAIIAEQSRAKCPNIFSFKRQSACGIQ